MEEKTEWSASQSSVSTYNLNEFCTWAESFTAYLTLQVLWKTSCNTDSFCLAAALTASSSSPLYGHKKGHGLLGFMAIEHGLSIQHCSIHIQNLSSSPVLSTPSGTHWKQLAHTEHTEPGAAIKCSSAFICRSLGQITALTVILNHQRTPPPESCAKHEHRLRNFCFFIVCRLDSQTYQTPTCGVHGLHTFKLQSW